MKQMSDIWGSAASEYDLIATRSGYYDAASGWIAKYLRKFDGRAECRALDLGCGTGFNVRTLRKQISGVCADGVDVSPKMIEFARAAGEYQSLYVHDLNFPLPNISSDTFDLIVAFGFLEFLNDAYVCLSECRRVLKVNGTLWATFQRFEARDAGSPPRLRSISEITVRGYSAGEILHIAGQLGMTVVDLRPVVGYMTPIGFACPYYVLCATRTS